MSKPSPPHLCQPDTDHRAVYVIMEQQDRGAPVMAINVPYPMNHLPDRGVYGDEYLHIRKLLAASATRIEQVGKELGTGIGEELHVRLNPVFPLSTIVPRIEFFLQGFAACDELRLGKPRFSNFGFANTQFGFAKPQTLPPPGLPKISNGEAFYAFADYAGRAAALYVAGARSINEFEAWCEKGLPQIAEARLRLGTIINDMVADPERPWAKRPAEHSGQDTGGSLSAFWTVHDHLRNSGRSRAEDFASAQRVVNLLLERGGQKPQFRPQLEMAREVFGVAFPGHENLAEQLMAAKRTYMPVRQDPGRSPMSPADPVPLPASLPISPEFDIVGH